MVELPDGTEIDGAVLTVANAAVEPAAVQGAEQAEAAIEVGIGLAGPVPETYREGAVAVHVTDEESLAATVVPTRALIALAEGGLAVELVRSDGTRQLVGVQTGLYEGGLVEITNGAVEPGDDVVVPS
jgi:hypothetical protein